MAVVTVEVSKAVVEEEEEEEEDRDLVVEEVV